MDFYRGRVPENEVDWVRTILVIAFSFGSVSLFLYLLFVIVKQQTAVVIQRFGKFARVLPAGLGVKIPVLEFVAGRVSLRIQELTVRVETKTKDNVFVILRISVQFFVIPEKVYQAFYKLDDPNRQITSFVFDVVRARVPKLVLDDVFERKDEIADAVKEELSNVMDEFGYGIVKSLVTDIDPDEKVKASMNEINAAQRLREAAKEKGEAEKILQVKAAEAEAESKKALKKAKIRNKTACTGFFAAMTIRPAPTHTVANR